MRDFRRTSNPRTFVDLSRETARIDFAKGGKHLARWWVFKCDKLLGLRSDCFPCGRGDVTCPTSLSRPFESKDAITIGASYFFHGIKISYQFRENVRGKSLFLSKLVLGIINIVILFCCIKANLF